MLINVVDIAHGFRPESIEDDKANNSEDRTARAQRVLENFRIIFKSVQRYSAMIEAQYGLSTNQLWTLWELFKSPGLKVSELSMAMSIHQSTASNFLDKLEQRRLIRRERHGPDQRVVRLFLTPEGLEVINRVPRPAQDPLTRALLRLSDKSLRNLETELAELVANQRFCAQGKQAETRI